MRRIYLDHAATTKPDQAVLEKMQEVNANFWANASSIHGPGQSAKQVLETSRQEIASIVGCSPEEIIFTSGGTEADNLAIKGIIDAFYSNFQFSIFNFQSVPNAQACQPKKLEAESCELKAVPHIITSAFEHHAVLDTVRELEKKGLIEATYVRPNSKGLIDVKDIEAAIKDNTILVSIMYVNNEIGTVQPISEIGEAISRINTKRQETTNNNYKEIATPPTRGMARNDSNLTIQQYNNRIFFHTDAVQAVEYFDINPDHLGVDMMSIAAHKFYGPKGIGALYVRKGTPIAHQQIGGGQERKRRAGTENVAGIAGMSAALRQVKSQKSKVKSIEKLRDKLIDGILKEIPDTRLNGDREERSPANANISFMNAEGESIILMLDLAGISASSGSACTSGSLEPSHVLLSLGMAHEEAHGSVRFTLGKDTTEDEIEKVLEVLPPIIERLRAMSPIKKAVSY